MGWWFMGQNKKNVHTQLLMTYVVRKKIVKCIAYKNTGNLIYIKYMKHIYVKKQVYLIQGSFQQNKFDKAPAARSRLS